VRREEKRQDPGGETESENGCGRRGPPGRELRGDLARQTQQQARNVRGPYGEAVAAQERAQQRVSDHQIESESGGMREREAEALAKAHLPVSGGREERQEHAEGDRDLLGEAGGEVEPG